MRIATQLKYALLSASAVCLVQTAPAFAQEAVEEGASASGEIIVTARRRDESIQDVPLVVNAVSAETIEKLNIRDAKDIAAVVPGLQLNPGLSVTGPVTSLRGLNVDVTASGNNGTVEFYLNDAPISGGVVLQGLFDIGQIEVLRGPQGTLRGRASPSGSITFTTRRPDMAEFGGFISGTATTLDGINIQGAVNLPIVKDVLAFRVAALFEDNDANRVYSLNTPNDHPRSKTRALRISARARPTDNIELNASYTRMVKNFRIYDQVESANLALGTPVVGTLITPNQRLSVEDVPRRNRQEYDILNWQAQWSFAGQRLNYVGSYTEQRLSSFETLDKGDLFTAAYPAPLQSYAPSLFTLPKQESHEVRLSSEERLFGMFDYIIGGFLNRLEPTTLLTTPTPIFAGSLAPANFTGFANSPIVRGGRQIERAIFGNLTAHIGEATEVAGGIRFINYQENSNGPNNTHKPIIWNASVKHRFSDAFMVYASVGSSWRIGSGTNPIILSRAAPGAVVDPYLISLFALTPERSKSYEIGFKSNLFDRRLTLNVSGFLQNFEGYIFSGPPVYVANWNGTSFDAAARTLSGLSIPVPAKVKGVEAEIAFRPSSRFEIGATLAYATSEIPNATVPCNPAAAGGGVPTLAQIQQGNSTRQVAQCTVAQSASKTAPFSATLRAEYNHPVSDTMQAFARGLVNIQGNNQNDPQNIYDFVPSYALANLYLGVRDPDGAWEVTAFAKNLFNTQRVLSREAGPYSTSYIIAPSTRVTALTNYRGITMTDPREFGLTARFAFGSR